jgi:hypothetical protein
MLAWRTYKDSLCSGCGHPKATAWHHHSEDSFVQSATLCAGGAPRLSPDETGKRELVKLVKFPVVAPGPDHHEDTRDYRSVPIAEGPPEPSSSPTRQEH